MVCHGTPAKVMELTPDEQHKLDQGRDVTRIQAQREEITTSKSQTDVDILKKIKPLAASIETIESCLAGIIDDLMKVKDISNVSECLAEDRDELIAKWSGIREVSDSNFWTISPFHLIVGNLKMSLEFCISY